jgi:hypothetical protein
MPKNERGVNHEIRQAGRGLMFYIMAWLKLGILEGKPDKGKVDKFASNERQKHCQECPALANSKCKGFVAALGVSSMSSDSVVATADTGKMTYREIEGVCRALKS